ncbi:sigma factor [Streptomyces bobili]|uniref:sigma factor n=1 Tax=Streptomyces bobili TaxID=67280 RepID=UPI00380D6D1D
MRRHSTNISCSAHRFEAISPPLPDLYHQRRLDMVRLAMLLVDDLPTAEDVVQEAFTALYRRHGVRLDGVNEPAAYLRTSVINAARSVLRRRRTLRAYVPERAGHAAAADERILASENHQQVLAALGCLTGSIPAPWARAIKQPSGLDRTSSMVMYPMTAWPSQTGR